MQHIPARPIGLLAIAVGAAYLLNGCTSLKYGPLAVFHQDDDVVVQVRGGAGRLEIGPCVVLAMEQGDLGLAWRDSQTEWAPLMGQIEFLDPTRGTLLLSPGDMIEVGGEHLADEERVIWLARPSSGCGNNLFVVHEVKPIAYPLSSR